MEFLKDMAVLVLGLGDSGLAMASGWARRPAVARIAHRITGGLLIGAGAGLAAIQRS